LVFFSATAVTPPEGAVPFSSPSASSAEEDLRGELAADDAADDFAAERSDFEEGEEERAGDREADFFLAAIVATGEDRLKKQHFKI
jgi:hypothetical protein